MFDPIVDWKMIESVIPSGPFPMKFFLFRFASDGAKAIDSTLIAQGGRGKRREKNALSASVAAADA